MSTDFILNKLTEVFQKLHVFIGIYTYIYICVYICVYIYINITHTHIAMLVVYMGSKVTHFHDFL